MKSIAERSIAVNEDIKKAIEEMIKNRKDELDRDTIRILEDDSIALEEKIIHPVVRSLELLSLVRFYLNDEKVDKVDGYYEFEAIKKAVNEAYILMGTSFELHSRTH